MIRPLPPSLLRSATFGVALAALALSACGYALVGRGSNIPDDVETVYLAALQNRTQRPQVEQFLTQAIADELVKRGRFTVVNGPAGADASLTGAVVAFGATPVAFDGTGRATEYEISITASVELARIDPEEILWSNSRYIYRENYEVDAAGGTGFLDRETEAIEEAAERFAETMVSDLLLGF